MTADEENIRDKPDPVPLDKGDAARYVTSLKVRIG